MVAGSMRNCGLKCVRDWCRQGSPAASIPKDLGKELRSRQTDRLTRVGGEVGERGFRVKGLGFS